MPFLPQDELLPGMAAAGRNVSFPVLDEDEEQSIGQKVLGHGLSALGYVGSSLDKLGARPLRGLLAGKPRELLSILPLSDTVGITRYEDSVSGEDLLHKYGIINKNRTTGSGLAGFAAEVALDPLNLVTLGGKGLVTQSLKRAGKAEPLAKLMAGYSRSERAIGNQIAERAAARGRTLPAGRAEAVASKFRDYLERKGTTVFPADKEDIIRAAGYTGDIENKALANLYDVHLPWLFGGKVVARGPSGPRSIKIAQAAADWKARQAARLLAAPGIRNIRPLFDATALESADPRIASLGKQIYFPELGKEQERARRAATDLRMMIEPEVRTLDDKAQKRLSLTMRALAEKIPEARAVTAINPATVIASDLINSTMKRAYSLERMLGVNPKEYVNSHEEYLRRSLNKAPEALIENPKLANSALRAEQHRKRLDALTGIPGGSQQIEWLVHDPKISGWDRTLGRKEGIRRIIETLLGRQTTQLTEDAALAGLRSGSLPLLRSVVSSRLPGFASSAYKAAPDLFMGLIEGKLQPQDLLADPRFHSLFSGKAFGNLSQFPANMVAAKLNTLANDMVAKTANTRVAADVNRWIRDPRSSVLGIRKVLRGSGQLTDLDKRINPLWKWLGELHPENVDPEVPFWKTDVIGDVESRLYSSAQTRSAAKVFWEALKKNHGVASDFRARNERAVRLGTAIEKLGFKNPDAYKVAARVFGVASDNPIKIKRELDKLAIDIPLYNELRNFNQKYVFPRNIKVTNRGGGWQDQLAPLGLVDNFNSLFKALVYSLWPSSHVRNIGSGAFNTASSGAGRETPGAFRDVARMLATGEFHGRTGIPSVDALANPSARAQALKNELYNLGAGYRPEVVSDLASPAYLSDARPLGNLPGYMGPLRLRDKNETTWNPLKFWQVSGFGGRESDRYGPVKVGRRIGRLSEDLIRGANLVALTRAGYSPQVAADLVTKFQFEYSRLSEWEKNVMKRLIPFYSYSRFNLPLQVDQLFNNPKLMSAQLRAFNTFRDREYTPSYVGEGASFKIGKPVQGNQLYLTQLGLPIEEALGRLKMGDYFPDVWETLSRNVAMSTPLIKYPLEAITGKQLSTGRQLSDLKPGGLGSLYGNLDEVYSQPITQLLANSPFARLATTIDKVSDTRKSIPTRLANVLTGVKFTTIDLERAKAIDTRRALEALLKAAPRVAEFGEFYVPPEQRAGLPPDLVELLRLFATMKQRARKAAAERRFMEGLSR